MYYRVLVASQRYHKPEALTYESGETLHTGDVISVPLQQQNVVGVVLDSTTKPRFSVKPVTTILHPSAIDRQHLELLLWLQQYYPGPSGITTGLFLPSFLLGSSKQIPDNDTKLSSSSMFPGAPPLTAEQQKAIATIQKSAGHSVLLHGLTGSGKTRVYTELADTATAKGQSVVVMTPEIGLTPQLTKSFEQLGKAISVLHSGMTPKERRQIWHTIAACREPQIIIGPRSALFAPVKNVGLIIIDEMHDTSYKQEQSPHYSTPRVAARLAQLYDAKLVLGSATPPVADYYLFEVRKLPIVTMQKSAIKNTHPIQTDVVDLKDRTLFTSSPWISKPLLQAIEGALQRKEQSLIFLNRRGTARVILCQNCGWQALCPRCDLPLTYHADTHKAICHTCGYSQSSPTNCPVCQSTDILFKSAGTKSIASELARLFPSAKIKRFDSDLKKTERLDQNYQEILTGGADILVGTQMLGKGLDLPKLAVVGVVLADTTLNFPDFTAEERTFQALIQVLGRVGRGHTESSVIVQTHHPKSLLINYAMTNNYRAFYEEQLRERQKFHFPPYYHLLKLSCTRKTKVSAQRAAQALAEQLQLKSHDTEIIGPSPAFIEKGVSGYTWQIVIKARKRADLLRIIKVLPSNWHYDLDPSHLL